MEIIYFYQYFGTTQGGWSTRVYEMSKIWIAAGHNVTVVTSPYDKSDLPVGKKLVSRYTVDGINVISINLLQSNKHTVYKRVYTFCAFSFVSVFFSLALKYDVIITSSGPLTIGIPGLLARYIRGRKLVFEVRDLWPDGAIQLGIIRNKWIKAISYRLEKACYRASGLIVACSDGMRNSIERKLPHAKVAVVPNASDVALFQQPVKLLLPQWASGRDLFLYTGSLGLIDDCQQIIRAAVELKRRKVNNMRIVLIGDGAERADLEELCARHALDDVHFLGLMPKTQVAGWLQRAYAALVVVKNVEVLQTCSPNKLFDAFAAGVPVIQSTQGWIKQTLQTHGAGLTVSPDDPSSLADAMELLLKERSIRNRMAEKSLSLAMHHFNRGKLAQDFLTEMVLLANHQKR